MAKIPYSLLHCGGRELKEPSLGENSQSICVSFSRSSEYLLIHALKFYPAVLRGDDVGIELQEGRMSVTSAAGSRTSLSLSHAQSKRGPPPPLPPSPPLALPQRSVTSGEVGTGTVRFSEAA